jgi:hypothetical protein
MATLINADTSDGLKLTSDTSGEIEFQSAGVTKAGVNATGLTGDGSQLTGLPAPAALTTASGSAPSYSARAWVNFNGTGTVAIRASGNVSSITDNGTGDYTVNFTTAMSDANYVAVGSSCSVASDYRVLVPNFNAAPTTSACRVRSSDKLTTSVDDSYVNVSIFR